MERFLSAMKTTSS